MVLNSYGMWSKGIEIACFSKTLPSFWELSAQTPKASDSWGLRPQSPVCDTFELPYFTWHVSQFKYFHILTLVNQTTAFGFPFYDIFAQPKVTFSKVSDDVIAYTLWFFPPKSKILATRMVFNLAVKTYSKSNSQTNLQHLFVGLHYKWLLQLRTWRAFRTLLLKKCCCETVMKWIWLLSRIFRTSFDSLRPRNN